MSDLILEQQVSAVEKNLKRIDQKLDYAIEQDHERLTRLEDVLAEFIKENRAFIKENKEGFAQLHQDLAASQKRNDAGFAQLRQEMGKLSHRLGTLVEDLVAPSLPRILSEVIPCPADSEVLVNVRTRRRHPTKAGKMLEIDAFADCGNYVLFNETKSQLTPEKVKDFLDKLVVIREYFPEYQHHTVLGCVSSLMVEASLIEYASRQGLLVLGTSDGIMALQNAAGFTWRAF